MRNVLSSVPDGEPSPTVAPHDERPPQALLDFMVTAWAPAAASPEPLAEVARFQARRERLSARFPSDVLVIPTGHEKVRANDTNFRFRPGTDFYYLTGNTEPDAVLVMLPGRESHSAVLFVEPNPGKTDATFYTDRSKGELWVGPRLGIAESAIRFGLEARGLPELAPTLERVERERSIAAVRVVRGIDPELDTTLVGSLDDDRDFAAMLSEMRLLKDEYEVAELERAIASTHKAFDDVVRGLPGSTTERHVEGIFNLRARVEGNDVGYGTIAAAGAHACTLHWTANDGPLRDGELLLLDAGVETNALYTADITRTIPISGRFSREQRDIYELVLAAQDAAFAKCAPGNAFMAPNAAAMVVLAHGLERLGILPMAADIALRESNQFYKRYSLHNVSHMLGLDVHDCAKARQETYKFGTLEAGMVLTVEPGLYLQPDDLTVPERYRGIGVRIEDDVVITPGGCRILSAAIPRDIVAVEAWVGGHR